MIEVDGAADRACVHSRVIDAPPERVFRAIAEPAHLARWWGPKGFTSTFETFDFRPGGTWRFVLHGPDGTSYPNHNVFREIVPAERVVVEHIADTHHFFLTITLASEGGRTRVGWRQVFDTAEHRDRIAEVVLAANEQNLDRLAAEAGRVGRHPIAIVAAEAPPRLRRSFYPEPFASRMEGRRKQPLGDLFGLANFGVNLTRIAPGGMSALRHAHTKQDEFVYVLEGHPTLHTDEGRTTLSPGMCAGFKAGTDNGHCLLNETGEDVVYLEIGDRTPGDGASYPDDDIAAQLVEGQWRFTHKDGTPY